jgi:HAD superfamily phosphoserine phosphatase-like hydrolase
LKFAAKNNFDFILKKYIKGLYTLLGYKIGIFSLEALKAARVRIFLGHLSEKELENLSHKFTEDVLKKNVYKKALSRISWHQKERHDIYVVSASFDFCIQKWCKEMAIGLLTNKFNFETGKLMAPDCNFDEKVNRIKSEIPGFNQYEEIFAYGDTDGDTAMLNIADNKFFQYFN